MTRSEEIIAELRQAIAETIALVNEAYAATGYIGLTDEVRQRLERLLIIADPFLANTEDD